MTEDKPSPGSTTLAEVAALWAVHRVEPFPDGLRWIDAPSGESVPALDAFLAGCISTYLADHGTLGPLELSVLTRYATDLATVLPSLNGYNATYVTRLLLITDLITQRPQ